MQTENLIDILKENRLLRNEREMTEFIEALTQLIQERDPHILPELLLLFDDQVVNIPPLQTLLRYIHSFDDNVFVNETVELTPFLMNNAKEWLSILYIGILANRKRRELLKTLLLNLPENKRQIIVSFLEDIKKIDVGDENTEIALRNDVDYVLK